MRNLFYSINLTADADCCHTKVDGSEQIHQYFPISSKTLM
jgi:hypothetical protein